jgi:integrase
MSRETSTNGRIRVYPRLFGQISPEEYWEAVQPINHHHRFPTSQQRRWPPSQSAPSYALSLAEFQQLLAAAGNDAVATELRQIVTLLFFTGLRKRELGGLTWSDVDMEKRCMRVGSKDGTQRTVPFGHKVLQVLVDLAQANAGTRHVLGKSPMATLHRITQRLHALPCAADGHKLTLHCLRHSFRVRWMDSGGSMEGLKLMMGFSSPLPFETFLSFKQQYEIAARFQSQLEDQEAI